jgi:non-ribosomal peptide synthase protein (TIGR01720 family)
VRLEVRGDAVASLRGVKGGLQGIGERLLEHGLVGGGSEAEVSFNYLGQWDNLGEGATGESLVQAEGGLGGAQSTAELRSHLVDVTAMVVGGRLRVEWIYSAALHRRETVERYAGRMLDVLRELIERSEVERPVLIPQDFPLLSLSQEQVDLLQERVPELEDAYPLTPLQEGMLFHTLADAGSGAYQEQVAFEIDERVRPDVFEAAWRELVARHAVLRTAVLWEGLPEAVQVVARKAPFGLERRDWSGLSEGEQEEALAKLLEEDSRWPFELGRPPLMRVAVAELGGGRQWVLWSMHHVLLDGWSVGIVLDELEGVYQELASGRAPAIRPRRPFRDYVGWVRGQDRELARAYWRGLLGEVESANELPCDRRAAGVSEEAPEELGLEL